MAEQVFKFKDWVIESKIGQGGQSVILLASRKKLNGDIQKAAIRMMQNHENKSDELRKMEAEQFAHEYEILSRLTSAYIAPVLDFGLEPVPWIATEFISGMDMQKYLSSKAKADEATWVRFATHLLSGLSHAHSKKIIHQDIKPGNIMITDNKAVWIDFSSATMLGAKELGYAGAAGTEGFRAPERWLSSDFSSRSDIFSLGVTLYMLAKGSLPWEIDVRANQDARIRAWLEEVHNGPVDYRGLSALQKQVLQKMLTFDPKKRLEAKDLLQLLDAGEIGGATGLHRDATVLEQAGVSVPRKRTPTKAGPRPGKKPAPAQNVEYKPIEPVKTPVGEGLSFFEKYRSKWWFWVVAIYLIGLVPVFGYGYFLYREAASKTKPIKNRIRTFASWAIVFFPFFAYTSWPLAFIWAKRTGNQVFTLLGGIQVLSAVGMVAITAMTPATLNELGRSTIVLPPIFGLPVFVGMVAAIIATTMRPRYEAK